jgi:hypothetical protein
MGFELSRGGPAKEIEPSGAGEKKFERRPVAPNYLASVDHTDASHSHGEQAIDR